MAASSRLGRLSQKRLLAFRQSSLHSSSPFRNDPDAVLARFLGGESDLSLISRSVQVDARDRDRDELVAAVEGVTADGGTAGMVLMRAEAEGAVTDDVEDAQDEGGGPDTKPVSHPTGLLTLWMPLVARYSFK